ncbi:MAG: hypothetical protein Q9160_006957 [Pyrenula sp. 1 TL-2023]
MTDPGAAVNYPVHVGVWTNWSIGGKDGLYHQRQAILRNTLDERTALTNFIRILWSWRRKAHRPFRRIFPLVALSAVVTVGFTVASIFSSKINSAMGSEVLLSSPECGTPSIEMAESSHLPELSDEYNAYAAQRAASLRTVTHCAPLQSKDYRKTIPSAADETYVQYFYGRMMGHGPDDEANGINFTYEMRQQPVSELERDQSTSLSPRYRVDSHLCSILNGTCDPGTSDFIPNEDLAQRDGDVAVIFLSANGICFAEPTDDDLYSAHQRSPFNITWGKNVPSYVYYADEPATALGCKIQYQICDATSSAERSCSPWGSLHDVNSYTTSPKSRIKGTIQWALRSSISISNVVALLTGSSLTSRYRLFKGIQAALPDNQWQAEVENWHSIGLASMQGGLVDFAAGPENSAVLEHLWRKPSTAEEKNLCRNQKIKSASYANFSMMWLVIILLLGTIIILLEYNLESLIVWLEHRRIVKPQSMEWFANDTLQLQRLAHEELGLGDWSGCGGTHSVPVTTKGQKLGILDDKDPDHPRLINPFSLDHFSELSGKIEQSQMEADEARISHSDDADQCDTGKLEAQSNGHYVGTTTDSIETEAASPMLRIG